MVLRPVRLGLYFKKDNMKTSLVAVLIMVSVWISASGQITYKVNPDQTTFKWTGYYLFSFGEHYGTIRVSKGNIVTAGDQITGGTFEIDMKTLMDRDMTADDGG